MTLWLLLAVMTAAAAFAVLWPLRRDRKSTPGGDETAVYRDQLMEVERDRAAGAIAAKEAEAARIELSRRLLAAADRARAADVADAGMARWRRRIVALVALVLFPGGAILAYLALGSPMLPSQPL
ncbi:MAG: c-type cytochrome biogenesis protein CcmI, partial [Proteobacteria bacterium]|nr:c-type cytochrome biogenesis protein CcmI [Pseudomonadota bacterium]